MRRGFDSSTMVSFVLANKSEKKLLIHTSYVTFIQQNIARSQTRLRGSIKITLAESTAESFPLRWIFSEDRRRICSVFTGAICARASPFLRLSGVSRFHAEKGGDSRARESMIYSRAKISTSIPARFLPRLLHTQNAENVLGGCRPRDDSASRAETSRVRN